MVTNELAGDVQRGEPSPDRVNKMRMPTSKHTYFQRCGTKTKFEEGSGHLDSRK